MKVIMIDDNKSMHLIMNRMFSNMSEVEIVGSFYDTTMAYSYMMNNIVDLVFVDINMPRENGLDFARRVRASGWTMKLVFVTSHEEFALSSFDVYAYDYIVKPITQERIQATISRALSEVIAQDQALLVTLASPRTIPSHMESLTRRELEVLQLMSNGMTNKEIALAFDLTEGTIKNHIANIFGKLQVKNRVQAIAAAKEFMMIK